MELKECKFRYKKTHQRSCSKNFKNFKNLKNYLNFKGNLTLKSIGSIKSSGKQYARVFITAVRFTKKWENRLWSSLFYSRLDFRKTKGVRMGGGRGKHFTATVKTQVGSTILGAWLPRKILKSCAAMFLVSAKKLGVRVKVPKY